MLLPDIGPDRRAIRARVARLGHDTGRQTEPRSQTTVPPGGWLRTDVVAGAIGGAGVVVGAFGLATTVVLGAGAGAGLLWWRHHQRLERARSRQAQLPEALERLASALRSGSSVAQALGEAGRSSPDPLGPELAGLARATTRGRRLLDVLDGWTATHDDQGTRLAATALALAAGVGAAPARAVDGVAATLRERLEVAGERRALATQARASATVLSVAPIGFALLLGLTDGAAAHFLLRTPPGWACLIVGLALDLAGALWMARLTRTGDPR